MGGFSELPFGSSTTQLEAQIKNQTQGKRPRQSDFQESFHPQAMPQSTSFVKKRARKLYKFTLKMNYIHDNYEYNYIMNIIHYNYKCIKKIIYTIYIYLTFGAFLA